MRGAGYCKATLFMVFLLAGEWECNTILATDVSISLTFHLHFQRHFFFPRITRFLQRSKGLSVPETAQDELGSLAELGWMWAALAEQKTAHLHHHRSCSPPGPRSAGMCPSTKEGPIPTAVCGVHSSWARAGSANSPTSCTSLSILERSHGRPEGAAESEITEMSPWLCSSSQT